MAVRQQNETAKLTASASSPVRAGHLGEQPAESRSADLGDLAAAQQLGIAFGKVRFVDYPREQDLVGAVEEHCRRSGDQRDRDELRHGQHPAPGGDRDARVHRHRDRITGQHDGPGW